MKKISLAITCLLLPLLLQACGPAAVLGTTTGVLAIHDRRTLGTLIDDTTLELKVIQALSKDRVMYRQSNITPISYNNVILLTGQTPKPEYRLKAENIAKNQSKVRYVYNEIEIAPAASAKERATDTFITTKIKAEILTYKHIDPTRFKVHTSSGVVYLMGLTTHHEAAAATSIARQVHGVEKVTKIFEYID